MKPHVHVHVIFFHLLQEAGPFEEKAMVMGVLDKAFDIFIMKFGVIKRVYLDVSCHTYMLRLLPIQCVK